MVDKTRKDRDWLWGRIFGELSLWQDRARNLTPAQREHFLAGWQTQPTATFVGWMERYMPTVIEAGASRGEEDRRIGEIMWEMTPEMMRDASPLGSNAYLAYYQERGEHRTIRQQALSEIGSVKSPRKAAASRENGKKGGRPSHKKTYHVVARQTGAEFTVDARDPMKAANAACAMLAETLPAEYTSSHPLTVRCVDEVGNVLAARNLWHRCPDGAVRSRPTQEFRS